MYVALVRGNIEENEATIEMPIARDIKDRKKMAVSKKRQRSYNSF